VSDVIAFPTRPTPRLAVDNSDRHVPVAFCAHAGRVITSTGSTLTPAAAATLLDDLILQAALDAKGRDFASLDLCVLTLGKAQALAEALQEVGGCTPPSAA
jgi:hypothetical protein